MAISDETFHELDLSSRHFLPCMFSSQHWLGRETLLLGLTYKDRMLLRTWEGSGKFFQRSEGADPVRLSHFVALSGGLSSTCVLQSGPPLQGTGPQLAGVTATLFRGGSLAISAVPLTRVFSFQALPSGNKRVLSRPGVIQTFL